MVTSVIKRRFFVLELVDELIIWYRKYELEDCKKNWVIYEWRAKIRANRKLTIMIYQYHEATFKLTIHINSTSYSYSSSVIVVQFPTLSIIASFLPFVPYRWSYLCTIGSDTLAIFKCTSFSSLCTQYS